MKRYRINLVTMNDVQRFLSLARTFNKEELRVADTEGHEVSAQSLLGMLYSLEWAKTYLYSRDENPDVSVAFGDFIVDDND